MLLKDIDFRKFDHSFIVLPVDKETVALIESFPDYEEATVILTVGYIDYIKGLSLEVLAAGVKTNEGYSFFKTNIFINVSVAIFDCKEEIENKNVVIIDDDTHVLQNCYRGKIDDLDVYLVGDSIEKTRKLYSLDGSREQYLIDTVKVYLGREGFDTEQCWVRITGIEEKQLTGILIDEPKQDFGYHRNEEIDFSIYEIEKNKYVCYADMSLYLKIGKEELENGQLLESMLDKYLEEPSYRRFIDILIVLKHSRIWVPCTSVLHEEDKRMLNDMIDKDNNGVESMIGEQFQFSHGFRMIPDILTNQSGNMFFPVFSQTDQSGEYGLNFSFTNMNIDEVINLAKNNKKKPTAIIINAFSQSIIVEQKLWDFILNIRLRDCN